MIDTLNRRSSFVFAELGLSPSYLNKNSSQAAGGVRSRPTRLITFYPRLRQMRYRLDRGLVCARGGEC